MEIDSVGVEDHAIFPTITDDVISSWTSPLSFEKGYTLYSDNKPKTVLSNGQILIAKFGTDQCKIFCKRTGSIFNVQCSCTKTESVPSWCYHVVATLLVCIHKPENIVTYSSLKHKLSSMNPEVLKTVILNTVFSNLDVMPEFNHWVSEADRYSSIPELAMEDKVEEEDMQITAQKIASAKQNMKSALEGITGRIVESDEEDSDDSDELCDCGQHHRRRRDFWDSSDDDSSSDGYFYDHDRSRTIVESAGDNEVMQRHCSEALQLIRAGNLDGAIALATAINETVLEVLASSKESLQFRIATSFSSLMINLDKLWATIFLTAMYPGPQKGALTTSGKMEKSEKSDFPIISMEKFFKLKGEMENTQKRFEQYSALLSEPWKLTQELSKLLWYSIETNGSKPLNQLLIEVLVSFQDFSEAIKVAKRFGLHSSVVNLMLANGQRDQAVKEALNAQFGEETDIFKLVNSIASFDQVGAYLIALNQLRTNRRRDYDYHWRASTVKLGGWFYDKYFPVEGSAAVDPATVELTTIDISMESKLPSLKDLASFELARKLASKTPDEQYQAFSKIMGDVHQDLQKDIAIHESIQDLSGSRLLRHFLKFDDLWRGFQCVFQTSNPDIRTLFYLAFKLGPKYVESAIKKLETVTNYGYSYNTDPLIQVIAEHLMSKNFVSFGYSVATHHLRRIPTYESFPTYEYAAVQWFFGLLTRFPLTDEAVQKKVISILQFVPPYLLEYVTKHIPNIEMAMRNIVTCVTEEPPSDPLQRTDNVLRTQKITKQNKDCALFFQKNRDRISHLSDFPQLEDHFLKKCIDRSSIEHCRQLIHSLHDDLFCTKFTLKLIHKTQLLSCEKEDSFTKSAILTPFKRKWDFKLFETAFVQVVCNLTTNMFDGIPLDELFTSFNLTVDASFTVQLASYLITLEESYAKKLSETRKLLPEDRYLELYRLFIENCDHGNEKQCQDRLTFLAKHLISIEKYSTAIHCVAFTFSNGVMIGSVDLLFDIVKLDPSKLNEAVQMLATRNLSTEELELVVENLNKLNREEDSFALVEDQLLDLKSSPKLIKWTLDYAMKTGGEEKVSELIHDMLQFFESPIGVYELLKFCQEHKRKEDFSLALQELLRVGPSRTTEALDLVELMIPTYGAEFLPLAVTVRAHFSSPAYFIYFAKICEKYSADLAYETAVAVLNVSIREDDITWLLKFAREHNKLSEVIHRISLWKYRMNQSHLIALAQFCAENNLEKEAFDTVKEVVERGFAKFDANAKWACDFLTKLKEKKLLVTLSQFLENAEERRIFAEYLKNEKGLAVDAMKVCSFALTQSKGSWTTDQAVNFCLFVFDLAEETKTPVTMTDYSTFIREVSGIISFGKKLLEKKADGKFIWKLFTESKNFARNEAERVLLFETLVEVAKKEGFEAELKLNLKELFKLKPTFELFSKIKTLTPKNWDIEQKELLRGIPTDSEVFVDIYANDGDYDQVAHLVKKRYSLFHYFLQRENLKDVKSDKLKAALASAAEHFVLRTWMDTTVSDPQLLDDLLRLEPMCRVTHLERIHKLLTTYRTTSIQATDRDYNRLCKMMEEIFHEYDALSKLDEFEPNFQIVLRTQKNRPKCVKKLEAWRQEVNYRKRRTPILEENPGKHHKPN